MGREVKRVALDFDWPRNKVWEGFLNPFYKYMHDCPDCKGSGNSVRARELYDMWYGYVEFDPHSTGSAPFPKDHPIIVEQAKRNVFSMENRYVDVSAYLKAYNKQKNTYVPNSFLLACEVDRLLSVCFNSHWSHHLNQKDVDALVKANRLYDFTHTWSKGKGWEPKNPPYHPTAKEVNEWSLQGGGHDSCNQYICVKDRCRREGVPSTCPTCKGEGHYWESPELKKKSDKWKEVNPPTGTGYQIWETVSEGSPVSPVFEKPEDLAKWMVENDTSVTKDTTYNQWLKFIKEVGSAPSLVSNENGELKSGTAMVK